MVANKIGESVEFEGVTYTVGAAVSVNKTSDYAGLVGKLPKLQQMMIWIQITITLIFTAILTNLQTPK